MRNATAFTPETYLTSHDAAKMIQANPSSINKWVKEGKISAFTTPGGHRRITVADFVAFLTKYEMPVPAVLAAVVVPAKPVKPKRNGKKKK